MSGRNLMHHGLAVIEAWVPENVASHQGAVGGALYTAEFAESDHELQCRLIPRITLSNCDSSVLTPLGSLARSGLRGARFFVGEKPDTAPGPDHTPSRSSGCAHCRVGDMNRIAFRLVSPVGCTFPPTRHNLPR